MNVKKEIIQWLVMLAAAALAALFINTAILSKAHVDSGSMIPTIQVDDYLICNKAAYIFGAPKRGDVVFFKAPDSDREYVKRIIGLPGEKVMIEDGQVYINDAEKPLSEPYLKEKMEGTFGPYEVPEGCYFVMGDNRNSSFDSRYWDTVYVEESLIYGKAWMRYSPGFARIYGAEYDE